MSSIFLLRSVSKNFTKNNSNLFRAMRQHDLLAKSVVNASNKYIVLPGAENFPQSCFVGDNCVPLCKGIAVATIPFDANRQGESGLMRNFFDICEMSEELEQIYRVSPSQKCDGSNVLCIGNNVFVGANEQTSESAHLYWKQICKRHNINYVPVPISDSSNLQSRVAWLGRDVGLFSQKNFIQCAKLICSHVDFDQKKIRFMNTIDMLRINNTVLHNVDCDMLFFRKEFPHIQFKEIHLGAMGNKDALIARSVATIYMN